MLKVRFLLLLSAIALLANAVAFASSSNWPRFRGPNGSGVADAKTIPVKWTPKDILWKKELPGFGNSSPVIWDGKVFVQAASKDGNDRMLYCLDAKDGTIKWTQKAKGKSFAKLNALNTLASATPAVDAERVYAVFWDGNKQVLNAFSHEGKPLWNHDLGSFKSQHGAGASPIAHNGKVYFNNDQDGKAEMFCFDAKSGKVVWSAPRSANTATYATPLIRTLPDGKTAELIVTTTTGLTGYDPDTGSKRWNWQWKFKQKILRMVGSPIYENGVLFAGSGDSANGPRHTVAVRLGDKTPQLVWENTKDFPYMSTPVAHGKHLYFVNDAGRAGCYEAETGKRAWFETLEGDFSSSPVIIDNKIYVANQTGDVYVIAANPSKMQILAKNTLGDTIRATPAVAHERLYVRSLRYLFCIAKQ